MEDIVAAIKQNYTMMHQKNEILIGRAFFSEDNKFIDYLVLKDEDKKLYKKQSVK